MGVACVPVLVLRIADDGGYVANVLYHLQVLCKNGTCVAWYNQMVRVLLLCSCSDLSDKCVWLGITTATALCLFLFRLIQGMCAALYDTCNTSTQCRPLQHHN
jgi:hypothetical protein